MARLTVGSLFAGIGGFDLGLELAGLRVAWQVECEPFCQKVLARHFPETARFEDVRDVGAATLPKVDVICGGFPCQDVSVAGQRAGLHGERTGLFFEFMRIVAELQPDWVLAENVPGLLTSHGGRDFSTVLETFWECGYLDGAYGVLDSRHFGVAQRRRRVFIVAHRGESRGRAQAVLFEPESGAGDSQAGAEARPDVAYALAARAGGVGGGRQGLGNAWNTTYVAATLRGRAHGTGVNMPGRGGEDDLNLQVTPINMQIATRHKKLGRSTGFGVGEPSDAAFTISANHEHAMFIAGPLGGGNDGIGRRSEDDPNLVVGETLSHCLTTTTTRSGRMDPNGETFIAATLNSGGNAGGFRTEPGEHLIAFDTTQITSRLNRSHPKAGGVRRLTPTECELLQSFPIGWTCLCGANPYSTATCCCPDSPRYRALGNAVTVNVAEWIGRQLLAVVSEESVRQE